MVFLIVSDIHANWEALQAVLEDARGRYDEVLCLGDLVGYGADPNEVVGWAQASVKAIVRGNHDKACLGRESLESYNPAARRSAEWTCCALSDASKQYLERLPRGPLPCLREGAEPFDLVHGSPLDEDEYLITPGDVSNLGKLPPSLTFFGHTHIQGGFLRSHRGAVKKIAGEGTLEVESHHAFLINPGSVGQPRDRDPRAAYLLYSPKTRSVEYRRAAYNIDAAAAKIRAAGLPDRLAARLYEGS